MRNILWALAVALAFVVHSCSPQSGLDSKVTHQLVESDSFTFMAKRANTSSYDVINIMNSLPNSSSSRMLQLDYGYTIVVKKDEITVTLPYFGRMYNPSFDRDKNSFRFTTKDFVFKKNQDSKGKWLISIEPKDVQHVSIINIEVFKNGNAFVSINASDRQPITYDGYIMQNEILKK